MQKKSISSSKLDWSQWLLLLPFILVLGIAPFFLHYNVVKFPAMPVNWKQGSFVTSEMFTYSKFYFTLAAGVVALAFLYFQVPLKALKDKSRRLPLILIASAIVWLLVTTMTSIYPHAAIWGGSEKYEGILSWLSYLVLAIYAGAILKKPEYKEGLLKIILFSGLIVTLIGLTQFLSMDIIKSKWVLSLILPKEIIDSTNFTFEANRVYTTLYNPNFVAMYVATIFPIACFKTIYEKNRTTQALWGIYSILLIINLIGSKSSGGYAGIGLSLGVAALLLLSKRFDMQKAKWIVAMACLVGALGALTFTMGWFTKAANLTPFTPPYQLTDVKTDQFEASFEYKGKRLIVKANPDTLDSVRFYTTDQIEINATPVEAGTYTLASPDFADIKFTTGVTENGFAFVNFIIDGTNWTFLIHPSGMLYINNLATTVPIIKSDSAGGFVGYENFGSARGYIWSRTLPVIGQSPLWGYGADTFIVAFPQNDYVTKYQLYGTPTIVVDKAHNLYLQLAVNFGIVGLILILSLIAYALRMLYINFYNAEGNEALFNLVIILCLVGYLGSGLFYDSNLHVSPFFWTLVGFGFKDLFKA